ncbi:MAG TPA: hypothetical protein VHM70_17670 [Polyangiaceae bacterium]|jgi:hypothetical protein|nr:hypothetical protein [Polyangiaceae bacterium]
MTSGGWVGTWSPGIGDPTLAGWAITVGYLLLAWQCRNLVSDSPHVRAPVDDAPLSIRVVRGARLIPKAKRASLAPTPLPRLERVLWHALCIAMLLLGINKQLDLQTALIQGASEVVASFGLEDSKDSIKIFFAIGLAIGIGTLGLVLLRVTRRVPPPTRKVLYGVVALLFFILMRALMFEGFARRSGLAALPFTSGVFELTSIVWIAYWAYKRKRELVPNQPLQGRKG